eukprot:TRINITY_DN56652_c0_g1_i2.p1 TRINITY_DN56652_c0_g1~~TRINITY_DN56652_c0_g1_i2.p1  ORF type:complete len:144 (+),score=38.64 TRINITY_DN56652_c0_g1_i2:214-645(+)
MLGGNFAVNLRGLDHYKEWGYKARFKSNGDAEFDEVAAMEQEGEDWQFVGYKHRRVVCFDGDSPHMATPIMDIPDGARRVIVGINVFGHNVGPEAARFPDHSARANRVIRMLQAFSGLTDSDQLKKIAESAKNKLEDRAAATD